MKTYGTNRKGQPMSIKHIRTKNNKKGKDCESRGRMYKGFNGSHRQFQKREIINILNELN